MTTLTEALTALDAAAKKLESVTIAKTQFPESLSHGDGAIHGARCAVEAAGRVVAVAAKREAAEDLYDLLPDSMVSYARQYVEKMKGEPSRSKAAIDARRRAFMEVILECDAAYDVAFREDYVAPCGVATRIKERVEALLALMPKATP